MIKRSMMDGSIRLKKVFMIMFDVKVSYFISITLSSLHFSEMIYGAPNFCVYLAERLKHENKVRKN